MILLELFAGTRSISKQFEKAGHETYSVEWSKDFENISLYEDINNVTAKDIIKLCGRVPDVIWASPDCTTYSIAAISHHRKKIMKQAILIRLVIMQNFVIRLINMY